MLSPSQFVFRTVITLIAICFASCCANKCSDDKLGMTESTIEKEMRRVSLLPSNVMMTFLVPEVCLFPEAVKAHACAPDTAPLVAVKSFQEVRVQRTGSPYTEIPVDISVYCNIDEFAKAQAF